jgi:hypothetical protein
MLICRALFIYDLKLPIRYGAVLRLVYGYYFQHVVLPFVWAPAV